MSELRKKKHNIDPFEIIDILSRLINPEQAFTEILRFITDSLHADCGQIIINDWVSDRFEPLVLSSTLPRTEQDFSTTILQKVINRKKAVCIPNALVDPQFKNSNSIMGKMFLSVISVPLINNDSVIGALYLDRRFIKRDPFNENYDLESLQTIANKLVPIIQMKNNLERLRFSHTGFILQDLDIIVGKSRVMRDICSKIEKYSWSDLTLFIYGETGVGKE